MRHTYVYYIKRLRMPIPTAFSQCYYMAVTNYKTGVHPSDLMSRELREIKERRRKVLEGVWKRRALVRERIRMKYASLYARTDRLT